MRYFERLYGAILLAAIWYAATDFGRWVSPLLLPPPSDVLADAFRLYQAGELWADVSATLRRVALGLLVGSTLGCSIGIVIAQSERLYRWFELPIELLRALPATAIFPFFLILFGLGEAGKIALVSLPTGMLMIINSYYGTRRASVQRKRMARVFGANSFQIGQSIVLYEALPQIAIGFRLAISLGLVVSIASEMFIGTENGIGQRIFDAYLTSSPSVVMVYVIVAGIVGYLANRIFVSAERRFIYWSEG